MAGYGWSSGDDDGGKVWWVIEIWKKAEAEWVCIKRCNCRRTAWSKSHNS